MLQVVTEVRESAEKARASALSAVEELDALRHRFINRGWHLTPIEGVTHDLPKSLISQPRKRDARRNQTEIRIVAERPKKGRIGSTLSRKRSMMFLAHPLGFP